MSSNYTWDDITWQLRRRAEHILELIRTGKSKDEDIDRLASIVQALATDRAALSLKILSQASGEKPSTIIQSWAKGGKKCDGPRNGKRSNSSNPES